MNTGQYVPQRSWTVPVNLASHVDLAQVRVFLVNRTARAKGLRQIKA